MTTLLERTRAAYGTSHSLTLLYMNSYGIILLESDQFKAAERVLHETLDFQIQLFTENHPDTIRTMSNYSLALVHLRGLGEAEQWNDRALTLTEENKVRGPYCLDFVS